MTSLSVRTLFERFSRGRVIKRTIKVRGENAPLFVTPDAQLKYLKLGSRAFDSDLIGIAERFIREDSIVWDLGANVGVFTFASASIASKGVVVSVEADVWLAEILRRTRRLNYYNARDIRIVPTAVSNSDSVAIFQIAERGRASNALEIAKGRSMMGGVREAQFVPTLTLGTLSKTFPTPDFVKIDVEGAELLVLEGGIDLIRTSRPLFYIEIGEDLSNDVLSLFDSFDYCPVGPCGEFPLEACLPNTFFVPKEQIDIFLNQLR